MKRPARILFHIRHFGVGGIENALIGWLRTLDPERFEVGLSIAMSTRAWEEVYRHRVPAHVRCHVWQPAGSRLAKLHQRRRDGRAGWQVRIALAWHWLAARRGLRQWLRRTSESYDLMLDFDLTLRKVAAAVPVPLVGVRHFKFWAERNAKARRVAQDYRHYDAIAVLNQAMLAQGKALFSQDVRQFVMLPNTFDLEAIRAAAIQPAPDILPRTPYVVCVARIDRATKGLDTLLRAWAEVVTDPARNEDLVLVGAGDDQAALEAMAVELGIAHRVRWAGLQVNPYPWIASARLLVLASRSEGMPTVLIEAMALGCPVVSTDCPVGPRELLAEGTAGILVPVDDVHAMAAAIRLSLEDRQLCERQLAVARQQVQQFDVLAGNQRMAQLVAHLMR